MGWTLTCINVWFPPSVGNMIMIVIVGERESACVSDPTCMVAMLRMADTGMDSNM